MPTKLILAAAAAALATPKTAEADLVDYIPYKLRNIAGIKRETSLYYNMKTLRNNSKNQNNLPSLHRLQGRTLTQFNLNRLRKNEQNTSRRQSQKKTKRKYKSKRKKNKKKRKYK